MTLIETDCITCGKPADFICGGCGFELCNDCIDSTDEKNKGECTECQKDMGWKPIAENDDGDEGDEIEAKEAPINRRKK